MRSDVGVERRKKKKKNTSKSTFGKMDLLAKLLRAHKWHAWPGFFFLVFKQRKIGNEKNFFLN